MTISLHRWFMVAGTFLIPAVVASIFSLRQPNEETEDFTRFFISAVADGENDDNRMVTRWGNPLHVCVVGTPSEASRFRVQRFLSLIRTSTALDIEETFHDNVTACSSLTFLHVHIHAGGYEAKLKIIEDISFIASKVGATKPIDIPMDTNGMGVIFANDRQEPFAYAAMSEFGGGKTAEDEIIANNVIQQEILQILLAAKDIKVTFKPRSLIQERWRREIGAEELAESTSAKRQWMADNVKNICLYDLIALKTLFSRDTFRFDGTLGAYKKHISEKFDLMQREARQTLADPYYQSLIREPC
ncbi:hypothetical protein [Rhizobium sp. AAP43]|uniref:hypothetical protein n=1 Tax=Rhizobium sp. AAP43 TaxID=1523420 RepID=UPI000ACFE891|nr:hypothetical protein [Rhizobium sp. AAP43]